MRYLGPAIPGVISNTEGQTLEKFCPQISTVHWYLKGGAVGALGGDIPSPVQEALARNPNFVEHGKSVQGKRWASIMQVPQEHVTWFPGFSCPQEQLKVTLYKVHV